MHAKLDELDTLAAGFDEGATGQAKMMLCVCVVGFKLSSDCNKEKIDELMPDTQECSDGTTMTREFPLTETGELINVIERVQKIAEMKRIVVLAVDDYQAVTAHINDD